MPYDAAWQRAVVLGAQGHYVEAWSVLDARGVDDSPALTLRASHLRQVGETARALELDHASAAVASSREERADALIGVAADLLCSGEVGPARERLDAAEADSRAGWRTATRHAWVGAECALASGHAERAVSRAEDAISLSRAHSARHAAKSQIIRAAAVLSTGAPDAHRVAVADLVDAAVVLRRESWATLQWPAALVALDAPSGSVGGPDVQGLISEGCAAVRVVREHLPPDIASRWSARPDVTRLGALESRARE